MPGTSEILEGLARISNTWVPISVAWHAALALALVAFVWRGYRPSARATAVASIIPLCSVAVLAWVDSNPFNGSVFTIAAIALWTLSPRIGLQQVQLAGRLQLSVGGALILFGWVYPHFLETHSAWMYAIAAPLGLIPCPTLALVIGVSLCFGAFDSMAWGMTTGVLGLFYGVFGVARLGVWLDLPLIVGSIVAIAASVHTRRSALTVSKWRST